MESSSPQLPEKDGLNQWPHFFWPPNPFGEKNLPKIHSRNFAGCKFQLACKHPRRLHNMQLLSTYKISRTYGSSVIPNLGNQKDVVEADANSGTSTSYRYICIYTDTLLTTDISSLRGTFQDDYPFPKVGYVSSPCEHMNMYINCCMTAINRARTT